MKKTRLTTEGSLGSYAATVTAILSPEMPMAGLDSSTSGFCSAGSSEKANWIGLRYFLLVNGVAAVPLEIRITMPTSPASSATATATNRLPRGS